MELSFENRIAHAMTHLEAAQATLIAEIKQYPTPVAGCDVQYNHLLEERSRVNAAIAALKAQLFTPTPRQLSA